jgi:hypothetical protein
MAVQPHDFPLVSTPAVELTQFPGRLGFERR